MHVIRGAARRNATVGLDTAVGLRLGGKSVLQDNIRFRKSIMNAAAFHGQGFRNIPLHSFMHQWRTRLHRLNGVKHGWKLFKLHVNQLYGLLGDFFIHGRDRCDFVSDVSHDFVR